MSLITDLFNLKTAGKRHVTMVNYALVSAPADAASIQVNTTAGLAKINIPLSAGRDQLGLQAAVRAIATPTFSSGMTDCYIGSVAPVNTELWLKNHEVSVADEVPLLENKPALATGAIALLLSRL